MPSFISFCRIIIRIKGFGTSVGIVTQGLLYFKSVQRNLSENGPLLFNMPKLSLDRLPELEPTKKSYWLETHAAMTLSARERRIRDPSQTSNDGLLNVKENLHALFVAMSASSSRSGEIFGLCHPQKGRIFTLILVSTVRLDLSAHTVVADAHILPLSQSVMKHITRVLEDHQKSIRNLPVSDEGMKKWGNLLAVSVERCREGIWKHQIVDCEYEKVGKFPTSTPQGVPLICSCGKGKASPAFISCKPYKPLISYVHRAAIGLIFPVPFYEQLFTGLETGSIEIKIITIIHISSIMGPINEENINPRCQFLHTGITLLLSPILSRIYRSSNPCEVKYSCYPFLPSS